MAIVSWMPSTSAVDSAEVDASEFSRSAIADTYAAATPATRRAYSVKIRGASNHSHN